MTGLLKEGESVVTPSKKAQDGPSPQVPILFE